MGEHSYERSGNSVLATVHSGKLKIDIGPPLERKIALLRIPYSEVSFSFENVTEEQQQAFKKHFDLHFQRGGG